MPTYFIRCEATNRIKIGKTISVEQRVSSLRSGHPAPIVFLGSVDKNVEALLHHELSRDRVFGEWFEPSEAVVSAIAKMLGTSPDKIRSPNPASHPQSTGFHESNDRSTFPGRCTHRLKMLRLRNGLTVEAAAERLKQCGVDLAPSVFNYWESGTKQPPYWIMPIIAAMYGVSVRSLLPKE